MPKIWWRPRARPEPASGRHAEALAAAIEALGAGGDTRATMGAIARASRAALNADRATVWVVDSAVGVARRMGEAGDAHANNGSARSASADVLRLDDPGASALFGSGAIRLAHDQAGDESQPLARRFQARSLVGMPFVRGGEVAGVVVATTEQAHRDWSADDITTLSALALQAGLTLERASLAAETQRLGVEDALTGLPNRTLFLDRLSQALVAAEHNAAPLALCVVNLDELKAINDALGHAAGDDVLREVASRLRGALRAHETVARLSSAEFGVLLPANQLTAELVAERLMRALGAPIAAGGQQVGLAVSLGIATYPEHGSTAEILLRRADSALASAHRAQTGFAVAGLDEDPANTERFALIAGLRQALVGSAEGGELELHYQPKVDCRSGQPIGAEALMRWRHPVLGIVTPTRFIPLAEQTGLIRALTRWALETAIVQCRVWLDAGLTLSVAVNLSAHDVQDPGLPDLIRGLLEAHGVPAGWLMLEITESMLVEDPDQALGVLARLNEMGVRAALDDFGTGYSSLAYLKRLPVHELKIDQSFVRDLVRDARDRAIVAAVTGLGHSLGMSVVAEGIEDEPTLRLLRELGIDVAQGYHLGRPQPASAFAGWLAARGATLASTQHAPALPIGG